jgi:hypothetical protein
MLCLHRKCLFFCNYAQSLPTTNIWNHRIYLWLHTATKTYKQNHCTIPAQIFFFNLWFSHSKSYIRPFCTMLSIPAIVSCHLWFEWYKMITSFIRQHRRMYTTVSLHSNWWLGKGKLYKTGQWTYTYINYKQFPYFSIPYFKKRNRKEQVS